jgi:hypothetical protein
MRYRMYYQRLWGTQVVYQRPWLDFNGNPTLKPFSDGARVDLGAAQIDKLEARVNETFLITIEFTLTQ